MRSITRSFRIRACPNGAQRRWLDRWYGAHRWLWNTALGIRTEAYRECGLNAAQNVRTEGFRRLAGRDDRDLRVDAGDACPEEILVQVLAVEARSGHSHQAGTERARFD